MGVVVCDVTTGRQRARRRNAIDERSARTYCTRCRCVIIVSYGGRACAHAVNEGRSVNVDNQSAQSSFRQSIRPRVRAAGVM